MSLFSMMVFLIAYGLHIGNTLWNLKEFQQGDFYVKAC